MVISSALIISVSADIRPKPSVRVSFNGLAGEVYATLLSKVVSTGPESSWDGVSEYDADRYGADDYEIWNAFKDYNDADGFYFLQVWWECSDSAPLEWTYYPPYTFKILLYFPETGSFAVSGIYERYAFDSYYTVDMTGTDISAVEAGQAVISAEESYDYSRELISFACRVVVTILLELGLALAFGLRQKRLFALVASVNIITQLALNIALNLINFNYGSMAFVFFYILLELAVFVLEAVIYALTFGKLSSGKISRLRAVVYALTANAASFAAGLGLAIVIPGIF